MEYINRIMPKFKLSILLFFFTIGTINARDIGFKHFTIDDGLPSNNVFDVFFDSKGYLWIGTDKGIVRYNGIEFVTFTSNDGLPDNEIFGFNEDYEGRLWISNFKGALCYYKDNVFHTEANTPWLRIKNKIPSNYFHRISLQKDSSLILMSVSGGSMILIKGNKIKEIALDAITKIFGPKGQHPILTRRINDRQIQLYYDHNSLIVDNGRIIKIIPYKDTLTHFSTTSLHDDAYFCTQKYLYNYKEEVICALPEDGPSYAPFFRSIHIGSPKDIFILSKYGLFYNRHRLLPGYTDLTDLDCDNYGNIWVGSLNNGIFCINKHFNSSFQYNREIKEKVACAQIMGDTICLVTESGKIYSISKKLSDYSKPPFSIKEGKEKSGQKRLFTKSNTCITPEGDIFSLQGLNIFYKRKSDQTFRKITLELHYPFEDVPTCKSVSYFDSTFFVSTIGSVLEIKTSDLLKNKRLNIPLDAYLYKTTIKNRLYQGAIHKADTTFFFSQANKMLYVKGKSVNELKALEKRTFRQFGFYGNYLMGYTDENKLYIYNTLTGSIDSLSDASCIWENSYYINDSLAILNTNNGYKFIAFQQPLKNGKAQYSLSTIENPFIPDKADCVFGDGLTYYFLKNGVLSSFPATMMRSKPKPPQPIFVSAKTVKNTFAAPSNIDISYDDSKTIIIQIDNISFNYKNPVTQYAISKGDKDYNDDTWNTITGNEISLNSIGISYGNYTIKLRSKTSASDFSKPVILRLHIMAPFWAKWWFIALCILLLTIGILGIIRFIIWRQLRKKQKEFDAEMKYQQSEYKALNALMNPHFIFNSLNNIQSLINKDSKQTANQYLVIFSKLIRQNMVNISKGYISLNKELQLVENYLNLEKLRFKNLIDFSINIAEDVDADEIMIPPLLIQPLVENSIIHGLLPMQSENSKLTIRVFENGDALHIDIEDNGMGIRQSLKRKNSSADSYGLLNIHKRIEHMKKFQKTNITFEIQEVVDENGKSKGTKASIVVALT
jgi:two-component sensor histidine kinase